MGLCCTKHFKEMEQVVVDLEWENLLRQELRVAVEIITRKGKAEHPQTDTHRQMVDRAA